MSSKIVTKDNFVHWAIENGGLYGVSGRISQNLTRYTIPLPSLTICYSLVTGSLYGCSQNEVKTFTEKILSLINSSLPGKAILQDSAMSCPSFSQCNKQVFWPAAKKHFWMSLPSFMSEMAWHFQCEIAPHFDSISPEKGHSLKSAVLPCHLLIWINLLRKKTVFSSCSLIFRSTPSSTHSLPPIL